LGTRTLTVTTGSEALNLNNAFTVTPGIPVITSVNPNTGKQGENVSISVTAQFTHFVPGTTQLSPGTGVAVNNVTVVSPTSLTAQAAISPAAGISARDVTVMTGTEVVTLKNGFNVTAGTPAITTAIPNTGQQGQNVTLAVMGQFTHFLQSTTQVSLGAGITV